MRVSMVYYLMRIEAHAESAEYAAIAFDAAAKELKAVLWHASPFLSRSEVAAYFADFVYAQKRFSNEFQLIRSQAYGGYLRQKPVCAFLQKPSIEAFKQCSLCRRALLKENFELLRLVDAYCATRRQAFCLVKAALQSANERMKKFIGGKFEECSQNPYNGRSASGGANRLAQFAEKRRFAANEQRFQLYAAQLAFLQISERFYSDFGVSDMFSYPAT